MDQSVPSHFRCKGQVESDLGELRAMFKMSFEGALGIFLSLIIFILEQAGVKNRHVLWGAFILAFLLCIAAVVRSQTSRRTRAVSVIIVLVAFGAFGRWLLDSIIRVPVIQTESKRAGVPAATNSVEQPVPQPTTRLMGHPLEQRKEPNTGHQRVANGPQVSAPNGIAISGDNLGTATVNNYGVPSPPPHIVDMSQSAWDGPYVDDPTPRPGIEVKWTIDGSFTDPAFLVLCDRPCKPIVGGAGGVSYSLVNAVENRPNVALLVISSPSIIHAGTPISVRIKSADLRPIRAISVVACRLGERAQTCAPPSN